MRIATFNINNINARLPILTAWLEAEAPDVVCLQELKADQGVFPQSPLAALAYEAVWRGQRTWNGVAILARGMHPEGPQRTFWSYLRQRWPRGKGLRIDHLLLSPELASQLVDAGVDRWVRGLDGASDHAPAWIVLDR